MLKGTKILVCILAVAGCVTIGSMVTNAADKTKDTVANKALNDYVVGQSKNNSLQMGQGQEGGVEGVKLSGFSIPIYDLAQSKDVLDFKGNTISGILKGTDEKLWFMMNQDQPKGIVVANSVKPLKMGGENRSKDLMKMYSSIKQTLKGKEEIRYFEFQGQGIFYVAGGAEERVYLSKSASQILKIPSGKEISPQNLLEKLKSIIQESK